MRLKRKYFDVRSIQPVHVLSEVTFLVDHDEERLFMQIEANHVVGTVFLTMYKLTLEPSDAVKAPPRFILFLMVCNPHLTISEEVSEFRHHLSLEFKVKFTSIEILSKGVGN